MKKNVDYSSLRGFNYSLQWEGEAYDHEIIERDMTYAERLHLNSARVFISYDIYREEPGAFLAHLKDFVQTAWKHGISSNPIMFTGFRFHPDKKCSYEPDEYGLRPLSPAVEDRSAWVYAEKYIDDLIRTIGDEPGLLFWDIANEPGYTDNFVTWYDEEPSYVQDYQLPPRHMEILRERQEKTWELVRHLCRYVKEKDPVHDIGVGNIFIWETEPSQTAELVDVLIFHDYSATRKRVVDSLEMAKVLSEKYGKPVVDNEMCCLCRANPYDMAIELHDRYHTGWYLFELMIGSKMWNRVHGVVYPDGTVRDPSIVAAISGFFRNRTETAIRPDVDQEDYVTRADILAQRTLLRVRQSNMESDHKRDVADVLECCEFIANLLEGGEYVPMCYPPTAKIEAYRRRTDLDVEEAADYLVELLDTLKKATHFISRAYEGHRV